MRITRSSQEKLQNILKAVGFQLRYEKGNFQGGHCVVMEKRLIVINKFHPLESKISVLADLVRELEIDEEKLSEEQIKLVAKLKQAQ